MEKFSNWQTIFLIIVLALAIAVFLVIRSRQSKQKKPKKSDGRKGILYEQLTELLLSYTELAEQLAHEYRYAFKHADQLTPESEEAAEEIIASLENTEKQIREKCNQLMLTDGSGLATQINNFLIPERNIRHASPKDLEKYTGTARQQYSQLIQRMREDLNKTNN